jgi:hypothetical protein
MAETLLCEHTQNATATLGVNWPYTFTKYRPELYTRYNQKITYQRARQENPKVIKKWF